VGGHAAAREGARPLGAEVSVTCPVVRDEPDDWSDPGAPLPPEDRLWRHPSELVTVPSATATTGEGHGARRRTLVTVAVLSGLTGAAATVVSLVAIGTLGPRTVERIEPRPVASQAPTTTVRTARAVASSVAPAVVEVAATVGSDRRRGSGVVVRADGLILTSAQLVEGAASVVVTWPSGRTGTATVEGHDDLTGLAALNVEGGGFPTATLDTTPPEPGERAITVAAWAGSGGPTLTQGVINATGSHADPDGGRLIGLIETDQPVPGWADGGALIDGEGLLRGVCISVEAHVATGFAVPTDVALRVAEDLDEHGRVDRGWLGVRGSSTAPGGSAPVGVAIDEVAPGSPAEGAGLQPGDVVIAVDQSRVRSLADIQAALTMTRPGQQVQVERDRDGTTTTVEVVLAAAPSAS
jgi:putative serine protease PepD